MAHCRSCEYFGIKGVSLEWCYRHNYSTHGDNNACSYYSSKW